MKRRWWDAQPFKRQIFLLMASAICATALIVELIMEPLVEGNFFPIGSDLDWHEAPIWLLGTLIIGVGLSLVLTRMVMRRLAHLARAAEEIALGNLSARVPVAEDHEDVFTRISARFNAMAETIECLLDNERRLLSDISHELRSPLARMSAAVELMALRNGDGSQNAHFDRIESEIAHMNHLIGVLLKQNRNRLAVREGRTILDVGALASETVDGFEMQGIAQKVSLKAEIAPGIFVDGHPMQVRLIFENILSNALYHAPPETRVEIRLIRSGGAALASIRDYGPGVPEEALEKIFKPFFRVDPSRSRNGGGIGLGLSLVREACLALGGDVSAKNRRPGLEVTLTLPLSKSAAPAAAAPPRRSGEGRGGADEP